MCSKNAFDAKMHFCTALRCVAKMHFGIKCICNILCYKMYASNAFVTFCVTKCTHLCFLQSKKHSIFAQLNIFLWKMYAKMHFAAFAGSIKCICNILCYKMYASNAFVTFCVTKCTHLCFLQSKKHSIFAQLNIFLWKM